MKFHSPVLLEEVITQLQVVPGNIYVDTTLGNGGHTIEILQKGAIVYGIDQDQKNLKITQQRIEELGLGKNFYPIHSNFNQLKKIVSKNIGTKIDGLLADLGLSQNQQTGQDRGFSFNDTTSLDMRLDPKKQKNTAENIINTYSYEELFDIFTKYGQEKFSKPLILKIIRERQQEPIKTGERLANIIRNYYTEHHIRSKIDPSTKIFMSLRIFVNNEFENLKELLQQSLEVIKPSGVACFISFHSGEDRIIKQFIRQQKMLNNISKVGPTVQPSFLETKQNPLSRSAILRSYTI